MFLPGEKPIEEQMFTFYEQEGPECVLYSNSELDEMNVSYSTMMDMDDFQGCTGGEVYKQWYNRIPVSLRETVVKFWLDSNSTAIQQFAEEFRENYAIAVK
ncbi:hypothetical protein CAQUA_09295 [Corynebacterium aquatimens]|nr:hypothetical protein CAQUA_09295 [Corynebacterium aquatimens]